MRIMWYNGIIKEGSDQRGGTYYGVLFQTGQLHRR